MSNLTFAPRRLLLVHAHPDDESLFSGHIIAAAMERGARVLVLTLTRGERGHTELPELRFLNSDPLAMAEHRSTELAQALDALGGPQHKFLGVRRYWDSGVRRTGSGNLRTQRPIDNRSLAAASITVVADEILRVLRDFRPDSVVTYPADGLTGHPDHKLAHSATVAAVRNYRTRGVRPDLWQLTPPQRAQVKVGSSRTEVSKRAAIAAHRSQVTDTGSQFRIGELLVDPATQEGLRILRPRPLGKLREIARAIWALPLGIIAAIAGTLVHQARSFGDISLPYGIAVALLLVASLAVGLRISRPSRGALNLMLIGFIPTVFWLAQPQQGGEVFIPANFIGQVWGFGSIAIAVAIAMFPSLNRTAWQQRGR